MESSGAPKRTVAVALALVVFATVLGIVAAGDNVLAWDLSITRQIQSWQGGLGDHLYRVGDTVGTTAIAACIAALVLMAAIVLKKTKLSLFLVLVLLFRLLGTLLKPLFDSPRPTPDLVRVQELFDGNGYPSGHSMTAAMIATMFVCITWEYSTKAIQRWAILIPMAGTALLVGWSRIWAGAHWPSDVLGGWSYGIALVLIAWVLSTAITSRYEAGAETTHQRESAPAQ